MKKSSLIVTSVFITTIGTVALLASWMNAREREEQRHFEREETELVVANIAGNSIFMPVPIIGYRSGPEEDGTFAVTVRSLPREFPPCLFQGSPAFVYVPSGNFLLGDRLNPLEPHYVRLGAFFMSPCEVSNAEFKQFLNDPTGYSDDSNWTAAGRKWKANHTCRTTALLKAGDDKFKRFGKPDHPAVWVNWFEANSFCRWLTRKIGQGKWWFSLPNEAEWEKAGRGPDGFDYGLGMNISDDEAGLYNWRKNPDAPITVVGTNETPSLYGRNRYGLYHMSGNVVEWTQTINR